MGTVTFTLAEMKTWNIAELLARKVDVNWRLNDLEAQLTDPENESRGEDWRRRTKAALSYARREVAALNNLLNLRREERNQTNSGEPNAIVLVTRLAHLYEQAVLLLQDDTDEAWRNLEYAVEMVDKTQGPLVPPPLVHSR